MIKLFGDYLVEVIMKAIKENKGKKIVIRTKSSFTCIDARRGQRYACGKGKEGKYINTKDIRKFLTGKNIISYAVVNDDSVKLLSDDVKTLDYIVLPTESEFEEYKRLEEESREKHFINEDVKTWRKRLSARINDGSLRIFGYDVKDDTTGGISVILDLGDATMSVRCENEYNLELIKELISELQQLQEQLDSIVDDSEKELFFIKVQKDGEFVYEEVQGTRFKNKYGFDLFYRKIACGNYGLTHTATGIAIANTTTYNIDKLADKLDNFVAEHGEDKVVELLNSAIEQHGTVPSYYTHQVDDEVATSDDVLGVTVDNGINDDKNKVSRFLEMHDKVRLDIVIKAMDMAFKKVRSYNIDVLCLGYCHMDGIMNHSFSCMMNGSLDDYKFKDIFEIALFNELKEHDLIVDDSNLCKVLYDGIYAVANRLNTKDYFNGRYHDMVREFFQSNEIDSKRDNIITVVNDVLNDDEIEYKIEGKFDNVYDMLNNTEVMQAPKEHYDYSSLLYEFQVKYIHKFKDEFNQWENIIHTDEWDIKVDEYFDKYVYGYLKELSLDDVKI